MLCIRPKKSIENKAGPVNGWKDLLMAVGFRFEPAANGIPSSVFFPQADPEDRLSQCSASLQALLALTPITLQALAKLVNSVDVADDIIAVIRNVLSQFPPKGSPEIESCIEIPLSVRLWRVSGCHELLASVGFDLTEVGQDQVTLRTGKQANRRSCQFVLQALLALFDTQEAPKTLGLDSSSSCESLSEDIRPENQMSASTGSLSCPTSQQASISPTETVKSMHIGVTLPPLPINRPRILSAGGGAFISYVRRRGEPDGGRTDTESSAPNTKNNNISVGPPSVYPNIDSSLANTTDSELSDGYISQSHLKKPNGPRLGYSSLRGPVRVSRPGGGGESDAAFTPSPPVTTQTAVDPNVSLALAHQTRIRNLYSSTGMTFLGDSVIPELSVPPSMSRRPDSSSSTSSTTDWEGSGHATVLRRSNQQQNMPPLPPPRQNLPLVDSLRPLAPLAPVYNNLGNLPSAGPSTTCISNVLESASSDSEFERGLEIPSQSLNHFRMKPKIKLGNAQILLSNRLKETTSMFMDRLSVRTELSATSTSNVTINCNTRKPLSLPEEENTLVFNSSNLYFAPSETEIESSKKEHSSKAPVANTSSTVSSKDNTKPTTKSIQDTILRHMNREMTPTISEVYHERNLGLGLAPPLSKLLLSKNYDETENKNSPASCAIKSIVDAVSEIEINSTSTPSTNVKSNNEDVCSVCGEPANIICRCKAATVQKKSTLKPWLSNIPSSIVKASDLTTADILERQNKIKTSNGVVGNSEGATSLMSKRTSSPFSELCRRDEGDGRSVADSQCSSSYKTDVTNATITLNTASQLPTSNRNKFGSNS